MKLLIEKTGHSPSYAEICRVTGLKSLAVVHNHLRILERDGYILRTSSVRGIAICPDKVMHGFSRCDKRHELIFFQAGRCPLCEALERSFPSRQVLRQEQES